jgi:hypothetical protein
LIGPASPTSQEIADIGGVGMNWSRTALAVNVLLASRLLRPWDFEISLSAGMAKKVE